MTARVDDLARLPNWPRLLSRRQAAAYFGVAPATFDSLGVEPATIAIGRRKVWDRQELDTWVDDHKLSNDAREALAALDK